MGQQITNNTRYVVRLRNRDASMNTIDVWPEGEDITCPSQETARQRAVTIRDEITKAPRGSKYEEWAVDKIASVEVHIEGTNKYAEAIFLWVLLPRNTSAAA